MLLLSKEAGLWVSLDSARIEWAKQGFLTHHPARDGFRNFFVKFIGVCIHGTEKL